MSETKTRLTIPLGRLADVNFIRGFRRLRGLPLREAYALALTAGVVDREFAAFHEARNAAIRRISGAEAIPETDAAKLSELHAEMLELGRKEIELPLTAKVKFPAVALQEAIFAADELAALLDTILEAPEDPNHV